MSSVVQKFKIRAEQKKNAPIMNFRHQNKKKKKEKKKEKENKQNSHPNPPPPHFTVCVCAADPLSAASISR
jgi:hypothetical protein